MKKPNLFFASVLVLFSTIFLLPGISPVHAQTGTVCLIPTSASSCPSSPASITGTVGTQLKVSVFIQGSDHINGFDITLLADHTILAPAAYDLNGTILASPQTVLVQCLSGVQIIGTCSPTDTADTLHLGVAGAPGQLSSATTGVLFHAIYNVISSSAGTSLGFQTGCGSSTQPTSHTPLCVTITNGAITPVPENVQTAVFSTTGPPADFTLTVTPSTQTVARGSSVTFTVKVTGINGFGGTVNLSTTVTPNVHHSPTTTLPSSVGPNSSSTLTVSTTRNTPTGTYTITVTGTSGSLSHSASVTVAVTR